MSLVLSSVGLSGPEMREILTKHVRAQYNINIQINNGEITNSSVDDHAEAPDQCPDLHNKENQNQNKNRYVHTWPLANWEEG